MSSANNAQLIKLVVMGSGGVGKSALTVNYVQQIFLDKYDPTIEDSYRKLTEIDGTQVMLEILDTAGTLFAHLISCLLDRFSPLCLGTDQFTAMRDLYMKTGDGFVLCYSTIATSTFNDLPDLVERITRIKDTENPSEIPMLVVGTKVDLGDQRMVTTEQGQALAYKFGAGFLEVSSKARINVDAVFYKICKMVMEKKGTNGNGKPGKASSKKSKTSKCNLI